MKLNEHFFELKSSYLFKRIAQEVGAYKGANPGADIIRLGIGDVTRPLAPAVVAAMQKAAAEMGVKETFRGYDDDGVGYLFLREAIAGYYAQRGTAVDVSEIVVSDGAKSDLGNILELFATDAAALIPDPVYPAYVDTNVMSGHPIVYISGNEENGFLPLPDENLVTDVIYICSPNNPTGAAYSREQLRAWVDFANAHGSVILFDAAYEGFVRDETAARSIFEIPGSRTCAIEVCSLSKLAGFTGVRAGWTVVPKELADSAGRALLPLWVRRQTTKFNGVSYVTQRAAEAVFSPEGLAQCRENLAYYQQNAQLLSETLGKLGIKHFGGKNSPYIWLKCPNGLDSWAYFDYLLKEKNIVGTPGEGFGKNGDGYLRLTSFGTHEATEKAAARLLAQ
ncbi:MAG: LL-diaminopimelate aminotransferase [Oscillospiraceae bacterium]|jgi:LL-diaminopimelate aminotransferase|nr:LL-diaminopimelate aminotransferase [Oscillospiraceae bacterium]